MFVLWFEGRGSCLLYWYLCYCWSHITVQIYIQNISFNIAFIYRLITFMKTQCFNCSGMNFGILLLIGHSCLITYREYSVTMCSLRHTLLAHLIIISSWKKGKIYWSLTMICKNMLKLINTDNTSINVMYHVHVCA